MSDPRTVLGERLTARHDLVRSLERRDARIAIARLLVFLGACAVALAAWLSKVSAVWLALPASAFILLAVLHDRTLRALARARRAVSFHESAIARLDDQWAGTGDAGERYASEEHPYASDLDLFGKGSLYELICTARTRPGADMLASWLLSPATAVEIGSRQRSVADLAPRVDLREDIAVLGEDVRSEVHPERLSRWSETPRSLSGWLALPALALAALTIALLVLWLSGRLTAVPFLLALAVEWSLARLLRDRLHRVLGEVERPGVELAVLAHLLARLEREPFADERLRGLVEKLGVGREAASVRIGALGRTIEWAGWADNQLFAPIAFMLAWRLQAALAVERWRAEHGAGLRAWLAVTGELEALSSLGGHAFLFPSDPFPELAEPARGPVYEGEGICHPLLPRCVPNDVTLGPQARLLVVSGSNMSGKSTLLRTIGVNTVLALAGGPVRARRLRLSPLQLGATLRIQDSLAEGRSRFWAEITRLRAVMDLASGSPKVLFLFDELLAGTNSRDRRIGAEAVLRSLLHRGAIGLITTHDLALSELEETLGEVRNAHFEDSLRDGAVVFDYQLHPGIVTHSNALALMRTVGLDV